jgi:pyridoxine 4-dehydrogenase
MSDVTAERAGTLRIGGELTINRLGYGAMRLTGPGIWGEPDSWGDAVRLLRLLPDLGVNFIDTADSYGPSVSEDLIAEALKPYRGIHVATKAGLARTGPDHWIPLGRPEYLIQQAKVSCYRLGVSQIDLWQLHRIDPAVPREEQFGAVRRLLDEGVIRFAGLSEVTLDDLDAASKVFTVASVQNRYNLLRRESEPVLRYCERHDIVFIPWFPLESGALTAGGKVLERIAAKHACTVSQLAIAWLLQRSKVIVPIPGTVNRGHLASNVAAAGVRLAAQDLVELEALQP